MRSLGLDVRSGTRNIKTCTTNVRKNDASGNEIASRDQSPNKPTGGPQVRYIDCLVHKLASHSAPLLRKVQRKRASKELPRAKTSRLAKSRNLRKEGQQLCTPSDYRLGPQHRQARPKDTQVKAHRLQTSTPSRSETRARKPATGGLLLELTCGPKVAPPSGSEKEPAMVNPNRSGSPWRTTFLPSFWAPKVDHAKCAPENSIHQQVGKSSSGAPTASVKTQELS